MMTTRMTRRRSLNPRPKVDISNSLDCMLLLTGPPSTTCHPPLGFLRVSHLTRPRQKPQQLPKCQERHQIRLQEEEGQGGRPRPREEEGGQA